MLNTVFKIICFFWVAYFMVCKLSFAEEYLPVKTMPIEKKTIRPVITAFGSLEKKPQILYFEISGYLTKLLVNEGKVVKKGQLLAQLDTILIDNQKAQVQLSLQYAKTKLARTKKLKLRDILSQDNLEDMEYNYSTKLLELKKINEDQRKYFLYAPAKGKILKRFLDFPGFIDSTTPIFMMKSFKQPWLVTAQLTEQEVNAIKKGDIAKVYFNGLPQKVFTGRVHKIADSSEEKDGMLEVDIALKKAKAVPFLRAGMKAKIRIESAPVRGYPIPLNVFSRIKNNKAIVFVVAKDNKVTKKKVAKKQEVEIRLIKGTNAIVSTNLSEFDELIIVGQHNLKDGSLIQVIQE
jgi:RND family efflux transporter MFP subunit